MAARDDVRGRRVLYVAAEGARDVLPRGLESLGARVDVVAAYRSVRDGRGAESVREALDEGRVDLVTLTSASSVRGYVEAVGAQSARRAPAASIGPVTTEEARRAGLEIVAEARASTIDGLVEAVRERLLRPTA
jgi:uroporphyrinogen III methyltransferase/synthase